MTQHDPHTQHRPISVEERLERRAFSNAMRKGLKSEFDHVSTRSTPSDFMALLAKADQKAQA